MTIPTEGGTYLLGLFLEQPVAITVGRLGYFAFQTGAYYYSGSAMGPGGLQARIRHHLTQAEKPHWNIDHLRRCAVLKDIWYTVGSVRLECQWLQALGNMSGLRVPIPGFGSSDCREHCLAHLLHHPLALPSSVVSEFLARVSPSSVEHLLVKHLIPQIH